MSTPPLRPLRILHAAQRLGVSKSTIREWLKKNPKFLPRAFKTEGGHIRIPAEDVDDYLAQKMKEANGQNDS